MPIMHGTLAYNVCHVVAVDQCNMCTRDSPAEGAVMLHCMVEAQVHLSNTPATGYVSELAAASYQHAVCLQD